MIELNPSAVTKLKELIAEENNPALKLRVFVQGGGCSGMQYGFSFDEESHDDELNMTSSDIQLLTETDEE